MQENRLHYLDSIRGLASLSVVVYHVVNSHWSTHTLGKISCFVFNGADAVSLFFLLSGLVLSLPLLKKPSLIETFDYKNYVLKRVLRIFPVYITVLLFMYFYLHRHELDTASFYMATLKNKHHLLEQVILVRGWLNKILLPAWTLAIEFVISLLVPLFIIVFQKNKTMFYFLIPLVLYANRFYISIFVFHFVLGIIVANNLVEGKKIVSTKTTTQKILLLVLFILLYSYRHILAVVQMPYFLTRIFDEFLFLDPFFITGIGSFGLLSFVVSSSAAQQFLTRQFFIYLGKLSFCLYLTHWFFIGFFNEHWSEVELHVGTNYMFISLLVFVVSCSLLSSYFLLTYIEQAVINWSKRLPSSNAAV